MALICISLRISDAEHLFRYPLAVWTFSGKKMSVYFLCLFFFKSDCLRFLLSWILTSYQIHGLQIFLLSYTLPFHFVDFFFCCWAQAFKSDVVPSVDFCFCFLCFWYHIQKIFANAKFKELLFCFVLGVSSLTFKSFWSILS